MRITICVVFIYVIEIYYQQCFGLNFIDLPGFGSDDEEVTIFPKLKTEETTTTNSRRGGMDVSSEDSDSDKNAQRREQSFNGMKSNYLPEQQSSTSSVVTTTTTSTLASYMVSESTRPYPPIRSTTTLVTVPNYRRHWLLSTQENIERTPSPFHDDKDENIKSKISMLVQQTMHDVEIRMKTVQKLKDKHREEAPYRVGFILSMIKKSRDVLNELFNVAVKHRDEWKALEQLKIFELIVHTNVDTTNLVRQLVEIHIQNLNATAHGDKQTTTATTPHHETPQKAAARAREGGEPDLKQKMVLL